MMRRRWLIVMQLALLTISAFPDASWSERCEPITAAHPEVLIVVAGAYREAWLRCDGVDQLSYSVKESYPAEHFIAEVSRSLAFRGCQVLDKDIWNRVDSSSSLRRWQFYVDGTHGRADRVYQWMGEWSNESGDLVLYFLRYRIAAKEAPSDRALLAPPRGSSNLDVFAEHIPAAVLRSTLERMPEHEGSQELMR
jgi:hypothetical protein